jgi:hypothetical protein
MDNCIYLFIFFLLYFIFFTNSELYREVTKTKDKKSNMLK